MTKGNYCYECPKCGDSYYLKDFDRRLELVKAILQLDSIIEGKDVKVTDILAALKLKCNLIGLYPKR